MQTKDIMLVVDDVALDRQKVREIFCDKYEIIELEDGTKVMELLEHYGNQVVIIIMDMILPHKSGLEVLDKINADENYKVIPVIAYTSKEEYQVKALQKGAWDYILKSNETEIILARIENILARKRIIIEKQQEVMRKGLYKEYSENTTKQALLSREMQEQLKQKELQVECTKYLVGMKCLEEAFRAILQALNLYYSAKTTYLIEYETHSEAIINKYGDEKKNDTEDWRKATHKYNFLINNKCSACLVVNDPKKNVGEIELLENICYFIKSELAKRFVEKELRQTTDQLDGMSKSLQSGTVKCKNDECLTLIDANNIFWELIDYSKDEFKEKCNGKIRNIIRKNMWSKNIKEINMQLKLGSQIQVESCILKKNGEEIYVIDKAVLTKELDGEEYWYRTYIDITEQEKNKREIERRYQDEVAFGMTLERNEMVGSLRVNLNRKEIVENLYRYGAKENLFDDKNYDMISRIIRKVLQEKEDYVFTVLGKDKIGKEVYKKFHYSYVDKEKEILMLIGTDVTDIYEQEQSKNEMLRHALAAAEQENKAKTKFLSSMSHDIRTPMNAIVGMAQMASINLDNKEKLSECMEVITSSSNHLLGLINDVLDMSKIENGSMILAKESFSVKQLMEDVQTIMMPEIEKEEQKLAIEMENIVHDKLLGDPIRLNRVFINLLNNASKFTQKGGDIVFRVEEEKSTNLKIAEFKFYVCDNGRGIAKKNQKNIFEPFVREEVSAMDHIEGTGLGLSIVKSIVEASGGTVKVESEKEKGAKFIVSISFEIDILEKKIVQQEKAIEKKEKQEINLLGMNILLVEDHPINVVVAKNLLSSVGATIEVAQNGAVGLERFLDSKEKEFQIIFMDIQMPIMNGYETSKEIRRSNHPQAKTIPIIAMTANVFKEDIDMAKEVGMNGHIGKPVSVEAIAKVISKLGILNESIKS